MQFFRLVQSDIDPLPYLDEIAAVGGAFDLVTGRQDKIAVQREALAIPLRGVRKSAVGERDPRDVHESRWTTGSARYPLARRFLEEIALHEDAVLGRAKIVCLPAGNRVYPHIDRGAYYRARNRYHFVLRSTNGSWLRAADEEIRMAQGELWWFDNNQMHEAFNDGDEDRIHMIFDLLPRPLAQDMFGKTAEPV
ncbi:MAG: aspartyl/asparaginyl beta-hydroxylase domain-containing protein [Pseudomonadota bacterium]